MTDDRRRKPRGASGWTPRDLGLSTARRTMAALAMASGLGNLAGRLPGGPRADRYPRPVQGGAEQRRRMRQQERLARKRSTRGD